MIDITIARITILVLAIFMAAGGILGYVKAKSKPSLISGVTSAALLSAAYTYSLSDPKNGLIAADVISVLLIGVFLMRYKKTGKFMPSGMLIIVSLIAAVVIGLAVAGV